MLSCAHGVSDGHDRPSPFSPETTARLPTKAGLPHSSRFHSSPRLATRRGLLFRPQPSGDPPMQPGSDLMKMNLTRRSRRLMSWAFLLLMSASASHPASAAKPSDFIEVDTLQALRDYAARRRGEGPAETRHVRDERGGRRPDRRAAALQRRQEDRHGELHHPAALLGQPQRL